MGNVLHLGDLADWVPVPDYILIASIFLSLVK